jgi:hypothetical protein
MFALANNASLDRPVHSITQEDVEIGDKLNAFYMSYSLSYIQQWYVRPMKHIYMTIM